MSELQGLKKQLEDAKELIERRDSVLKLLNNREFKKVIIDDFTVTEAARLVGQSADPALTQEQRDDALSMAQAAGHLKRYIQFRIMMGDTAEREVPDIEAEIHTLMQEGDDD